MSDQPEHERIPVDHWWAQHPVPDLKQIPEERWVAVLKQCAPGIRDRAARTLPFERCHEAMAIVLKLDGEDELRRRERWASVAFPPPLPSGASRPIRARRDRQICFRISQWHYGRAVDAADSLGLKPAQLARLLTLRGIAQLLAEDA